MPIHYNDIFNVLITVVACIITGSQKSDKRGTVTLGRRDVEMWYHVIFSSNDSWNMFILMFADRLRPITTFNIGGEIKFNCHLDRLIILYGYDDYGFEYISN